MRSSAISPIIAAGALCAVLSAGCDDASPLAGTWVRTRAIGPDSDAWTLILRDDGTFSMSHVHLENGVSTTSMYDNAREGEYEVGDDGRISFWGDSMSGASAVTSLEDLAGSYRTFTQRSMYALFDTGNALFIGPDFNVDSAYTAGDSYDILFSAGQNAYSRTASLSMTDASGTIIEKRIESYTYAFVDDTHCTVDYSFETIAPTATGEGSVAAESCTYEYGEGQEVEGLAGSTTTVPLITFEYALDGASRTDYFAMFDGVLVSYTPSLLSGVISGNAFIKSAD
jgi:hypothetical protein